MLKEEGSNPSLARDASSCRCCSCCRRDRDCWGAGVSGRGGQSLVWPAGSSRPSSCAPIAGCPCPERLPPPGETPPIVWLLNWHTLGLPRRVYQGVAERVPVWVPVHSQGPSVKVPRGVLEPLWRLGRVGTAPEQPAGGDGTSPAVPGRERNRGTEKGGVT